MAVAYKVLGQVATAAATATTLYTCPASTQTVISTITVANTSATASKFRIAIRPNAATLATAHYIAYDVGLAGNDAIALTLGLTVDAADVVTVYASTATVVFNAYGSEIT